ncbi:hypothetical protein PF005_g16286 [Phytophthora fragariae]|uniref:Uncharacterized protein n=1 Tax=Phytophthora fragariae TaxID=53985 RepID=A0A6A3Y8B8_9STRA|nr:hypothetical protein PF009_g17792 [Phytophthora fragariae]KAE8997577.1 hypothetical protein PF011_g15424 [Phytophthora fragariae]KAE9097039.1 hypothetical protein PF010_g16112 [Phytophthora fragariae]KAE9097198.1 hypothetical protein PF007_g16711 [Phytophthora fragariae]KAE9131874.1 hypothetical protein PF006_g15409 [Phytophthora fragariae]
MQSIPFRLFVVNELDLQDADRSKQYTGHPLGVVDESECLPLWASKPGTSYPHELGLILLSGPLTTIKSLRLAVELARAPSQLSISTAMPTHQGSVNERRSLDAVSRYLSAEWKPCW